MSMRVTIWYIAPRSRIKAVFHLAIVTWRDVQFQRACGSPWAPLSEIEAVLHLAIKRGMRKSPEVHGGRYMIHGSSSWNRSRIPPSNNNVARRTIPMSMDVTLRKHGSSFGNRSRISPFNNSVAGRVIPMSIRIAICNMAPLLGIKVVVHLAIKVIAWPDVLFQWAWGSPYVTWLLFWKSKPYSTLQL